MRKVSLLSSVLLISLLVVSFASEITDSIAPENHEAYSRFMNLNSLRKSTEMETFIQELQTEAPSHPILYPILCTALFRFADWGIASDAKKIPIYQKAKEAGEKAIDYFPNNILANYAYALSCGRIAEKKGGLSALDLLNEFEKHLAFVLSIEPDHYLANYALGMRFRDAPWPMKDEKKAEEYYRKCIGKEPSFLNAYYDLALLLVRQNRKTQAKALLQQLSLLPPHPDWIEESHEIKALAEALLDSF